nr:TPA_asm: ND2 [Echinogammarus berilloni]
MLIHPASIVFTFLLVTSVFITVSANSWFMAWLGLEINLLAFIPLMINKKNMYSTESTIKYFLVQAFASVVLISSSSLGLSNLFLLNFLVSVALLLKMAAAPSHQWMPSLVDGLPWPLLFTLFTVQKMNPLMLFFFLSKNNDIYYILITYATFSALAGAVGGLAQTSLRKIMAYSSIAHMSWVLSAMSLGSWTWLLYFSLYAAVLAPLTYLFWRAQMTTLARLMAGGKNYLSMLTAISLASLAGLPPFTGFLPKFLVTQELSGSPLALLLFPLLSGTLISLFFYTRVALTTLVLSNSSLSWAPSKLKISSSLLAVHLLGLLAPAGGLLWV